MYCRNCREEILDEAVVCVKCGIPVFKINKFCQNCGKETNIEQEICIGCGVKLKTSMSSGGSGGDGKDKNIALILLAGPLFFGIGGIHRFYTGHIGIGIFQALTGGGFLVWALIDLMSIMSGKFKDSEGRELNKK